MKTFVFPYPEGETPAYLIEGVHIYDYPKQDLVYWVHGDFWYDYPDGKEPVYYQHQGYLYDYPTPGQPKFQLRPNEVR